MIRMDRPSNELLLSYLDMVEEIRRDGGTFWSGYLPREGESNQDFIKRLIRGESEPEQGLVAESLYWPTQNSVVVGRISLRHSLNANLKVFGGHIGYEVRPSARCQGVATEMLRRLLQMPKTREIGRLLLTCAPDNVGSIKTILKNGGVFERTEFIESQQRDTSYYWIIAS